MQSTSTSTSTPGNTKPGVSRSRSYFLTFWTPSYPRELPKTPKTKYLVTCEDVCPKTGKEHGHAFIYFVNPVGFNTVKKLFGQDCHVKRPISNSACIDYVLGKSGKPEHDANKHNFLEHGERPMDNGVHKTVGELRAVKDPEELHWTQYNTWKKIQEEEAANIDIDDWKKEVEVVYIVGPSGIGKTEKAKEIVRESEDHTVNIVKCVDHFWHGLGTASTAIYDDFRDSHMPASEFINFIDYNVQNLNTKGGSRKNNYKRIIITSIQHPDEIYRNLDQEPRKQWLRRMRIIELHEDY